MKTISSTFVRKYDDVFLFYALRIDMIAKTIRYHVIFLSSPLTLLSLFYSLVNKIELSHL